MHKTTKIAMIVLPVWCIYLFAGLIFNRAEYNCQVVVKGSPYEVWSVLIDESRKSLWAEGYEGSELLYRKINSRGAESFVYLEEDGETIKYLEKIKSVEINEHIRRVLKADHLKKEHKVWLEQVGSNTIVRTKTTAKARNWETAFWMWLKNSKMKKREQGDLNRLKALVEKG